MGMTFLRTIMFSHNIFSMQCGYHKVLNVVANFGTYCRCITCENSDDPPFRSMWRKLGSDGGELQNKFALQTDLQLLGPSTAAAASWKVLIWRTSGKGGWVASWWNWPACENSFPRTSHSSDWTKEPRRHPLPCIEILPIPLGELVGALVWWQTVCLSSKWGGAEFCCYSRRQNWKLLLPPLLPQVTFTLACLGWMK